MGRVAKQIGCSLVPEGTGRETRLTGLSRTEKDPDRRSEGRRDRDRIFYSPAWRRLGGVTQVLTPVREGMILHTRLTHSEKVAQVSRNLAETLLADAGQHETILRLGGLDADVAEAAALAHDLGHPPFGHVGEEVLDEQARARDVLDLPSGFEGNAQSFRILTKLERRDARYDGMDLTRATLAATAKYPWERTKTLSEPDHEEALRSDADYRRHWHKFNAYRSERAELAAARSFLDGVIGKETQSLEASIMDVADDITYAVHDLEDFYLAGILDMRAVTDALGNKGLASQFSTLGVKLAKDYAGYFDQAMFDQALDATAEDVYGFLSGDYTGSPDQQAKARQQLSKVIGRLISNVALTPDPAWPGGPHFALAQNEWHQVQVLKQITREFVVDRSDVALLQRGQQTVLENLVGLLKAWKDSPGDFKRLPPLLRTEIEIARGQKASPEATGYLAPARPERGDENQSIVDYICTFTDDGCTALYRTLTGMQWPRIGAGL
jgi:dGTPase